ncbi:MAG: DUF1127 domain-containing protein [Rhodospirillales bacterium]
MNEYISKIYFSPEFEQTSYKSAAPTLFAAISGLILRTADTLYEWQARAAQRRRLMELDDRMLGDIGISRTEAWEEWEKPFWRS